MSFTTRCPSCGTMFRVVADQLKISEGWVRCGHCADVFDATLYLQPWTPAEEEPPASPAPPSEAAALNDELAAELDATMLRVKAAMASDAAAAQAATAAIDVPVDGEAPEPLPPAPAALAPTPPPDADAAPDDEVSDFHAELERFAAGLDRLQADGGAAALPDRGVMAPGPAVAIPDAPAPEDSVEEPTEADESAEAQPVPGFVRQAQRDAFWRSTGMRATLFGSGLLLALALGAQWAVQERDRLAAWQPTLQPLLQRACDHLGCTVSPVRRLDAIVIDSTALVRRLGSFYSFDLVLKNTAPMALAVPALELSLTDIGDGVIARRVFLPEEWPDAPRLLPARDSVTISFRLSLALSESSPMAGYRAVVFYP